MYSGGGVRPLDLIVLPSLFMFSLKRMPALPLRFVFLPVIVTPLLSFTVSSAFMPDQVPNNPADGAVLAFIGVPENAGTICHLFASLCKSSFVVLQLLICSLVGCYLFLSSAL